LTAEPTVPKRSRLPAAAQRNIDAITRVEQLLLDRRPVLKLVGENIATGVEQETQSDP
jgi:hypothetical protein